MGSLAASGCRYLCEMSILRPSFTDMQTGWLAGQLAGWMDGWKDRSIAGYGCFLPDHQRGIWRRVTETRQLFCWSRSSSRGITACGPGGGSHQPRCCISATTGTLRLPLQSTRMPWISRYLRTQPLIPRLRHWIRRCAAASSTELALRQEEHKRDMMAPWIRTHHVRSRELTRSREYCLMRGPWST